MEDSRNDRFIETGEGIRICMEQNMICSGCVYSMGMPAECEKYVTKPMSVIDGGSTCPRFVPISGGDKPE